MAVLNEIDDYAGAVVDCEPVGTVAIPVRLLVHLHKAMAGIKKRPGPTGIQRPNPPGIAPWEVVP